MSSAKVQLYSGCHAFRQRLVISTLSGRPVRINRIRQKEDHLGIAEYEVKFLKLLDELTNGSRIEINETGTQVTYHPGLLSGGPVEVECGQERCVSYFLEPIMELAPFCKTPVRARLTGVTNAEGEPSVDELRSAWLPLMRKFILNDDALEVELSKRGLKPEGGGEVLFTCPVVRQLRPVQSLRQGRVKKVRGLAYATKVSPLMATRLVDAAKAVLKDLLGDVFITADHRKGAAGGNSPGYGLFLTAETTDGVVFAAEALSKPSDQTDGEPSTPEDVGVVAAHRLLDEIYRGGSLSSSCQSLAALYAVLCPRDVSKLLTGPLSQYAVSTLRLLRDLLDVKFRIQAVAEERDGEGEPLRLGGQERLQLVCVGVGFSNLNKALV